MRNLDSAVSCYPSVTKLQESQAVKLGAKHPKHQFNWLLVLSANGVCFIGNHKPANAFIKFQTRNILASLGFLRRPPLQRGIKIM